MKISNKFTLFRIIAAPLFLIVYNLPVLFNQAAGSVLSIVSVCVAIPLLAFAEFTDFLDGHFARKLNEVSDFGKMFDPFADVFLHLTTFACFAWAGYMPPVLFILIFYREFAQSFLRMVAAHSGIAIAARKGGKLKTVFYVVSGFVSLAQESLLRTGLDVAWNVNLDVFHLVGVCFYVVCVILSYASFIDYLVHFSSVFKKN